MLTESILHVLVEEGVSSKEEVLDTIMRSLNWRTRSTGPWQRLGAVKLLEAIAQTLELGPIRCRGGDQRDCRKNADEIGLATSRQLFATSIRERTG